VGFDWTHATDVVAKIEEEVAEIREAVGHADRTDQDQAEEEVGDLLFAIANLARKLGVEPETALRKANDKFTKRFTSMERTLATAGRAMKDMTLEELETEWQLAKSQH
jgi:ATP diphosphatase